MSEYRITFEAELDVAIDHEGDDLPADAEALQAVQDAIGHTGASVTDVIAKEKRL